MAREAGRLRANDEHARTLLAHLGAAFFEGYESMLGRSMAEVARRGEGVAAHYRPFYFEGAALGYLPRGYYTAGFDLARAESVLLAMEPRQRYLYYVGLGFWYGVRHARRPERLRELTARLPPLYAPLCLDGFGFKIGLFDAPRDRRAIECFGRAGTAERPFLYQGLGRSMFFHSLHDPSEFERQAERLDPERRGDLEFGGALALGFTHVDRPERIVLHVDQAPSAARRADRLTGITWALTAREMTNPTYFAACFAQAPARARALLAPLPALCNRERERSSSYEEWQSRTRAAVSAHEEPLRLARPAS